jgi:Cdc6-like AAA superfamily ATPase
VTEPNPQPLSIEQKYRLKAEISTTFTPGTPVSKLDLLSGREKQIDKILETVFSPGQHAAIYGERGVGKSSLANLIYDMVFASGKETFLPVRVNCSQMVSFHEIWRAVFKQLQFYSDKGDMLEDMVSDAPNSDDIREIFSRVSNPSILVLDEFDRVDPTTSAAMADTIKTLSDHAVDTTLVLVGVADSVEQLIGEHRSIDRALVQIPMPRMSRQELIAIITKGMGRLQELSIEAGLDARIADISKGLPHYTHYLAKQSALSAVADSRKGISRKDYENAMREATEDKSYTLSQAYLTATHSAKESVFKEVLLACALATDERGLFGAKDVREPLSLIMGKSVKIEAYLQHLDKFSQPVRGPVLKKDGPKRRFQYSFVEPMMQPYVLMKGLADGKIREEQLMVLSNPSPAPRGLLFDGN